MYAREVEGPQTVRLTLRSFKYTNQSTPKYRQHLLQFSSRVLSASSTRDTGAGDVKMEVDSMASTPLGN